MHKKIVTNFLSWQIKSFRSRKVLRRNLRRSFTRFAGRWRRHNWNSILIHISRTKDGTGNGNALKIIIFLQRMKHFHLFNSFEAPFKCQLQVVSTFSFIRQSNMCCHNASTRLTIKQHAIWREIIFQLRLFNWTKINLIMKMFRTSSYLKSGKSLLNENN